MERRASQVVRRNSENWLASQNSAITQPFDMKNMKFNRRPVNMHHLEIMPSDLLILHLLG